MKYALKDVEHPVHFTVSDQSDPTIYFSLLPQYAEELQKREKGIIFVGDNFVVGLLGKPTLFNVTALETLCRETSSKEVKARAQDQVKFDYKEKGKKPVVTKGICQFAITGQDFPIGRISELLKGSGVFELQ